MLLKLGVLNTKDVFFTITCTETLNFDECKSKSSQIFSHFMHSVFKIDLKPLMLPKLRDLVL